MDRELLIEIGSEELPASLAAAPHATSWASSSPRALKGCGCRPTRPPRPSARPRRLTVRVARIAERQTDLEELVNGPAGVGRLQARWQPDARGDRALPRKQGVEVSALERVETAEGHVPRVPAAAAGQGGRRRPARTCWPARCAT